MMADKKSGPALPGSYNRTDRPARVERLPARQWQADELPWHLGICLSDRQRRSGARLLSQVLWGEKASFQLIGKLMEQVSEPTERAGLQLQLEDEARHVTVFTRYIGLLDEVQPAGESLSRMLEAMLELSTIEEKLVGMHILIEGMALELFHAAVTTIDDPLLKALLGRVFVDESRHVAFGLGCTRRALAGLSVEDKTRVAREGANFALLSALMLKEEQANAAEFGLDLRAIQSRTLRVLFRRLKQAGMFEALELF